MTKEELRARPKDFSEVFAEDIDISNINLLIAYRNFKSEVDVSEIVNEAIRRGIRVIYPQNDPYCFQGVEIGKINVKAIMLVPGIAFTKDGKRLGRGGGFYDRTLAVTPACVKTIGICKKSQLLEDIPTEEHDMPVDEVRAY